MNKILFREFTETSIVWPQEMDLLTRHNIYFETRAAFTPEMTELAHSVRYRVYCLERKFEDKDQHAGGLETDRFDSHSIHGLLFHRPTGDAMGTVRLILPRKDTPDCLPIAGLLRENGYNLADHVEIDKAVEVSRFAISKQLRRRIGDERGSAAAAPPLSREERERRGNLPCLSLIQFLLRQSVESGVTYWTAVMEEKLLRMLAGMGIHFHSVGPLIFHHGLRQPSYCYLPQMLEEMKTEQRDYWNVITNGGELAEKLKRNLRAPAALAS
jgi:N-acyl amino acid synthase of PEP-CTERM/exosortase system